MNQYALTPEEADVLYASIPEAPHRYMPEHQRPVQDTLIARGMLEVSRCMRPSDGGGPCEYLETTHLGRMALLAHRVDTR